jgi:hypothetical protein
LRVTEYRQGFYALIKLYDKSANRPKEGEYHEKFILNGVTFLIHNPLELFSKESASYQSLVNHSMIVSINPMKTIIDEALESYDPKK